MKIQLLAMIVSVFVLFALLAFNLSGWLVVVIFLVLGGLIGFYEGLKL